jgi:hypothetical protein
MPKKWISTLMGLLVFFTGYSQQNVGIGTNTPTYPLTVIATAGGKGIVQKTTDVELGFYTSSTQAFIQTWSNHALQFSTSNGPTQMTLSTQGYLGIGNITPTSQLDINGVLRMRGGAPGAGKVLTSDANGLASWQTTATGISIKATKATLNVSQGFSNASLSTLSLKDNNSGGFADLSGFDNNNFYFAVTASTAGTYLITGQVTWDIINSYSGEKDFVLEIRNGVNTLATSRMISEFLNIFNQSTERSQQISSVVKLSSGQQINLAALQRTGFQQNILAGENLTYLNLIRLY